VLTQQHAYSCALASDVQLSKPAAEVPNVDQHEHASSLGIGYRLGALMGVSKVAEGLPNRCSFALIE